MAGEAAALAVAAAVVLAHVVVHEAGHVLAARLVGYRVGRVRLTLLGPGVEVDDGAPGRPATRWRWLAVHLGGPTANALAVLACLPALLPPGLPVREGWSWWWDVVVWSTSLHAPPLVMLVGMGSLFALVNLLPLPMADGGHVARTLLLGPPSNDRGTVPSFEAALVAVGLAGLAGLLVLLY